MTAKGRTEDHSLVRTWRRHRKIGVVQIFKKERVKETALTRLPWGSTRSLDIRTWKEMEEAMKEKIIWKNTGEKIGHGQVSVLKFVK
jgi:hypothetical protein